MSALFAFVGFVAAAILYFLPSLLATHRKHHNHIPIFVVNFFFGWTLIGWVACLAWAFSAPPVPSASVP